MWRQCSKLASKIRRQGSRQGKAHSGQGAIDQLRRDA
jgi:hypothetical protein